MAKLCGVLQNKQGSILPYCFVIARIASDPAGDTGSDTTDSIGYFEIDVSNSGTLYDLYINSEGGGNTGPNWIGKMVSSGAVVSSFVITTDATWLVEHKATGVHKAITADNITLNATSFFKTTNANLELRLGGNTSQFRFNKNDSVYWLDPYPIAGALDYHTGLREGYDDSIRNFYFGIAKTRKIDTEGDFNLHDGSFGAVTFTDTATFNELAIFDKDFMPRLDTYAVPADDRELASKKYVDDSINAASTITSGYFKDPVKVFRIVDDADKGGAPPGGPGDGESYVCNNWGVPYIDDHIYEWNTAAWVDCGLIVAGTKVIISAAGAGGSFSGHESEYAIYDGYIWSFLTGVDGWTTVVKAYGSYYHNKIVSFTAGPDDWEILNP